MTWLSESDKLAFILRLSRIFASKVRARALYADIWPCLYNMQVA